MQVVAGEQGSYILKGQGLQVPLVGPLHKNGKPSRRHGKLMMVVVVIVVWHVTTCLHVTNVVSCHSVCVFM